MSDTPGTPEGAEQAIPYTRFQQVVSQKNELSAQIESLQGEIQTLSERAATADTLSAQLREAQAQAQAAEGKWTRWQSVAGALGTTDSEAIEAAEWAHGRLPEEGRPELGAWISTIKADPTTAPKVLLPWLQPSQDAVKAPKTPPESPRKPKAPPTGTQPPGAPSALSAEELRRVREEAVRTGDWSRWKELRKNFGGR